MESSSRKWQFLHKAAVVGSIATVGGISQVISEEGAGSCDLFEFRLDCYPETPGLSNLLPKALKPALITARHPAEGGLHDLGTSVRARLLRAHLPHAAVVDLEVRSLAELADLASEINANGCLLLASYHNFTATPSLSELRDIMARGIEGGAGAVKIATTIHGPEDIQTLVSLFSPTDRPPLAVMGMGRWGKMSRLLFASLGSVFNYGYLDAATVPGQWSAKRLKTLLPEILPDNSLFLP